MGRIERAFLAVALGFVFMFVASTAAPGLQTLVARVACPTGTTSSAVVRYPHVERPAEMVRNTPLVCVRTGGTGGADGTDRSAVLASHWRVLPALFALGLVGAALVLVVVGRVGTVLRSGGDADTTGDPIPPRRRTTLESVRFLPLLVGMPCLFLATFGGYWWLAVDTPYRVSSCQTSDGGAATCYDGEPVYRSFTLGFGAASAVCVGVWGLSVARSFRRDDDFRDAWTNGVRTHATLVADNATRTEVNGRRVRRFTYEVRPEDGSPAFRFEVKGTSAPAGGVGAVVPVVYDRGDHAKAFLLADR